MSKSVTLKQQIPSQTQLKKVTQTEFSTFVEQPEEVSLTVDEFFGEYERLFYDIPIQGDFNSHEYLAKRSAELANFEKDTSDIQPLLDEIALLRERVLALTVENLQLQTPISE